MSGANAYQDPVTVKIGGVTYGGWTAVDIKRSIEHMCSSFDLEASSRWSLDQEPWSVMPFTACQIFAADDLLLTGYVDTVMPEISGRRTGLRIIGRSKTEFLVDCYPEIQSGQYSKYNLGQIARNICALFGIEVVIATDVSNTFADATIQRGETAYKFLERLCRLSGVLACDDEQGRLVLTNVATGRSGTTLQQGTNLLSGHAMLSGAHRYSDYIVKSQTSIASWGGFGGVGSPAAGAQVETGIKAVAKDPAVPLYRPHVTIAESQLDQKGAQLRADWQARYEAGQATRLQAVVKGFRQDDGTLWQVNKLLAVQARFCGLDQDLLVAHANFHLDQHGHHTELVLGPTSSYAPDPGQVKLKGKGAGGTNWDGFGGVGSPNSPIPKGVVQT